MERWVVRKKDGGGGGKMGGEEGRWVVVESGGKVNFVSAQTEASTHSPTKTLLAVTNSNFYPNSFGKSSWGPGMI